MSEAIRVIRKVVVKSIVTEKLINILSTETRGQIDSMEGDYVRFQEQRDGYIAQCREKDVKPDYEIMKKMAMEEERFKGTRRQMEQKLAELGQLKLGEEFVHGTVDSPVEVQIGDNWHAVMTGVEVVLDDGVVQQLRKTEVKL